VGDFSSRTFATAPVRGGRAAGLPFEFAEIGHRPQAGRGFMAGRYVNLSDDHIRTPSNKRDVSEAGHGPKNL